MMSKHTSLRKYQACVRLLVSPLKWLKAAVNHFIVTCLELKVNDWSLAVNNYTFTVKEISHRAPQPSKWTRRELITVQFGPGLVIIRPLVPWCSSGWNRRRLYQHTSVVSCWTWWHWTLIYTADEIKDNAVRHSSLWRWRHTQMHINKACRHIPLSVSSPSMSSSSAAAEILLPSDQTAVQ